MRFTTQVSDEKYQRTEITTYVSMAQFPGAPWTCLSVHNRHIDYQFSIHINTMNICNSTRRIKTENIKRCIKIDIRNQQGIK